MQIQPNTLDNIFEKLKTANDNFTRYYPGDNEKQQPVHTLYGGAQLYKSGATKKIGELSLKAFNKYAPTAAFRNHRSIFSFTAAY